MDVQNLSAHPLARLPMASLGAHQLISNTIKHMHCQRPFWCLVRCTEAQTITAYYAVEGKARYRPELTHV